MLPTPTGYFIITIKIILPTPTGYFDITIPKADVNTLLCYTNTGKKLMIQVLSKPII